MAKINLQIKHAKREQIHVKALIGGPSGSGKSYSALRVATGIAGRLKAAGENDKIGYIGTEGMRDVLYASEFEYDVISLEEYDPDHYEAALDAFLEAGYKIIVVDSMTHLWNWVQDQVQKQSRGDNTFKLWGKYKKENNRIVEKILLAPAHIIVTGRGKDEYILEANSKGKMTPRKVGVGVQQDKDIEYEYMVTWMLNQDTHIAEAAKDNTHIFEDKFDALTEKSGEALYDWANDGEPVKSPAEKAAEVKKLHWQITEKCKELGGRENKKLMDWYGKKFGGNHEAIKDLDLLSSALAEMESIAAQKADQKDNELFDNEEAKDE